MYLVFDGFVLLFTLIGVAVTIFSIIVVVGLNAIPVPVDKLTDHDWYQFGPFLYAMWGKNRHIDRRISWDKPKFRLTLTLY